MSGGRGIFTSSSALEKGHQLFPWIKNWESGAYERHEGATNHHTLVLLNLAPPKRAL